MSSLNKQISKLYERKRVMIMFLAGIIAGAFLSGAILVTAMPSMMIITKESRLPFDETVESLKKRIKEKGWSVSSVIDLNKSLAKHNVSFSPRITQIKLCRPEYAESVLTTDRHVSTMMPCTFSVWEGADGKIYLSKMNMGLMGKMFVGNIAKVMGGRVAKDEKVILAGLLKD